MDKKNKEAAAFMIKTLYEDMRESDFQRDFFESLADQFEDMGSLSEKQYDALKRMYERVTG